MKYAIIFLSLFLISNVYASEFTSNYNLEIPSALSRDWLPTISKDIVSIDAALKVISIDSGRVSAISGEVVILSDDSAWSKSGTNVFLITSSNKVGIGTASPSTALDVIGTLSVDNVSADNIVTKGPYIDVRAYGATLDGSTDDTTSINNAITACNTAGGGIVFLPEGSYAVSTLTMKSNVLLMGSGMGSIIKSSTTANGYPIIKIDDCVGSGMQSLKVDGESNNALSGSFNNCIGIEISGNTSQLNINNVWVYDAHRFGVYVHAAAGDTVEDVFMNNLKVEYGCDSNQMIIGTITGETGNIRNIFLSDIVLKDGVCDGMGVWRQDNGGQVSNVNITNIIIENFATGATGQGFWIHDAQFVNLSNFNIRDGSTASSNGIKLEDGKDVNISNGSVKNVAAYGFTISSSTQFECEDVTLNNIVFEGNQRGTVLNRDVTMGRNIVFNNVICKDNQFDGFWGGGEYIFYNNCVAINNCSGDVSNYGGFVITGQSSVLSAENIYLNGCHAFDTKGVQMNALVLGSSLSNIHLSDCSFKGVSRDIYFSGSTSFTEMVGEKVSIKLRERVNSADTYSVPVFHAMSNDNYLVAKASLMFGNTITNDANQYNTYTLRRVSPDGTGMVTIDTVTTRSSDGARFFENRAVDMNITSNTNVLIPKNHFISFDRAVTGGGQGENDGVLILNLVEY